MCCEEGEGDEEEEEAGCLVGGYSMGGDGAVGFVDEIFGYGGGEALVGEGEEEGVEVEVEEGEGEAVEEDVGEGEVGGGGGEGEGDGEGEGETEDEFGEDEGFEVGGGEEMEGVEVVEEGGGWGEVLGRVGLVSYFLVCWHLNGVEFGGSAAIFLLVTHVPCPA